MERAVNTQEISEEVQALPKKATRPSNAHGNRCSGQCGAISANTVASGLQHFASHTSGELGQGNREEL